MRTGKVQGVADERRQRRRDRTRRRRARCAIAIGDVLKRLAAQRRPPRIRPPLERRPARRGRHRARGRQRPPRLSETAGAFPRVLMQIIADHPRSLAPHRRDPQIRADGALGVERTLHRFTRARCAISIDLGEREHRWSRTGQAAAERAGRQRRSLDRRQNPARATRAWARRSHRRAIATATPDRDVNSAATSAPRLAHCRVASFNFT